jgi:hypothetical protein
MRVTVLAMFLLLGACSVEAQESAPPEKCFPVQVAGRVEVTTPAGPIRATLLCIGADKVVLASEGRVDSIPLSDVQDIVKPADGIADGFLKGAAVAGIVALLCGECGDLSQRTTAMVVYGAIGAGIDALHGGRETIYRRNESSPRMWPPAVGWRIRF